MKHPSRVCRALGRAIDIPLGLLAVVGMTSLLVVYVVLLARTDDQGQPC